MQQLQQLAVTYLTTHAEAITEGVLITVIAAFIGYLFSCLIKGISWLWRWLRRSKPAAHNVKPRCRQSTAQPRTLPRPQPRRKVRARRR